MSRFRPNPPAARHGVTPSCVVLPPGPWRTVLEYLVFRFNKVPAGQWQARLARGDVVGADGIALTEASGFVAGQRLYYFREVEVEPQVPFSHRVIYHDAHIVVADKPHFLPVIPSGKYVQQTLLIRLKRELGIDTLTPVHRIDRDTAGLVLFSVNPATRNAYHALFRERKVHKTYLAVAAWNPAMHWPLVRESHISAAEHFMQQTEGPGPVNAITRIEPLQTEGGSALYKLEPVTGQRHQLRVHMNALGLPIENDGIYPHLLPEGDFDLERPLQLLAQQLSFEDPVTGVQHRFESDRFLRIVKINKPVPNLPFPA